MSARPVQIPAEQPVEPSFDGRRLRHWSDESIDVETGISDDLTEEQVDAMLMPRPLPLPSEAPSERREPIDGAGLRWALIVSIVAWAALVATIARG